MSCQNVIFVDTNVFMYAVGRPHAHYEASLQITAGDKLFDQQTSHDGLSRPWVICKEKSEGLAGHHRVIYRSDLMRQRVDDGRMYGEHRVEEMG